MTTVDWKTAKNYDDIRFEKSADGIAKITICRPEVRNAFRPRTLFELIDADRDVFALVPVALFGRRGQGLSSSRANHFTEGFDSAFGLASDAVTSDTYIKGAGSTINVATASHCPPRGASDV